MARNLLAILAVVVLCAAGFIYYQSYMQNLDATENGGLPTEVVQVDGVSITVEVASTEAEREQGLSNRPSLANGHGMLFVFPQDGIDDKGIWMKDMNFPLDIVWMASDGTIVTIMPNVATSTYAENPPGVFYPTATARYVMELPARFTATNDIEVGDKVQL